VVDTSTTLAAASPRRLQHLHVCGETPRLTVELMKLPEVELAKSFASWHEIEAHMDHGVKRHHALDVSRH